MVVILVTTRTSKHSATHDQEGMKARVRVIVHDASNRKQVCVSYINTLVLRCFINLYLCVKTDKERRRNGSWSKTNPRIEHREQRTNKQPYRDVRRW